MKQNLPNDNKILAAIATVAALAFFGLWSINSSECGGVLHIKRTGSSLEVILDKRNCKVPTIADTPGKPLALDHTNDSTEEQPLID
ncbi:MAG TPA: hypothetical protein VE956_17955 [Nodularia sp. (in: cyanobacteria)]|nr:hypothetical protein [Nodularia sp. (in: cyanobacteria)]